MVTKHTKCPFCEFADLGDKWTKDRKLQQYCKACAWVGTSRTPEIKKIVNTKLIQTNTFSGFRYEIYDQYGFTLFSSKSYCNKKDAKKCMQDYLYKNRKDSDAGPLTAVLWPNVVEATGEVCK